MRLNEPSLSLGDIPDEFLAGCGLRRGGATESSFGCDDPDAFLVAVGDVFGPRDRSLDATRLRRLLRGIHQGASLPPIIVFREPGARMATLLDGMHRWRASVALGFASIPATQPSREDAVRSYQYHG